MAPCAEGGMGRDGEEAALGLKRGWQVMIPGSGAGQHIRLITEQRERV